VLLDEIGPRMGTQTCDNRCWLVPWIDRRQKANDDDDEDVEIMDNPLRALKSVRDALIIETSFAKSKNMYTIACGIISHQRTHHTS
jgi:hypothetical protein